VLQQNVNASQFNAFALNLESRRPEYFEWCLQQAE